MTLFSGSSTHKGFTTFRVSTSWTNSVRWTWIRQETETCCLKLTNLCVFSRWTLTRRKVDLNQFGVPSKTSTFSVMMRNRYAYLVGNLSQWIVSFPLRRNWDVVVSRVDVKCPVLVFFYSSWFWIEALLIKLASDWLEWEVHRWAVVVFDHTSGINGKQSIWVALMFSLSLLSPCTPDQG